uniref:Uncharacterized protein LOC102804965 n=1 Tax=Saccoglossus kowalevskii TaxID=10224 RepID=A0ABM0M8E4_SACKO|nr:PREDICTED: uncharacterized protein LOC102804965 [Saccoglossus kowalevskii]
MYVDSQIDKGNFLEALVNYNMLMKKIKMAADHDENNLIRKQLTICQQIIQSTQLNPEDLQLLIHQINVINTQNMDVMQQSQLIDVLWSISFIIVFSRSS